MTPIRPACPMDPLPWPQLPQKPIASTAWLGSQHLGARHRYLCAPGVKNQFAHGRTDMSALSKLAGFQRAPAGLQWTMLRCLPMIALAGTLLPLGGAVVAPLVLAGDTASVALAATLQIVLASVPVLRWTVVFTAALLCVIVLIAKGLPYVGDAYPLIDSDRPAR